MGRRKLTEMQKWAGVYRLLETNPHWMTANEIGKLLGFSTGRPVQKILCDMVLRGDAFYREDKINTGTTIYLFSLTDAGRATAEQIRQGTLPLET